MSPHARVLEGGNVLVFCVHEDPARSALLRAAGAEVVVLPDASGKVDLPAMMRELARRELNEIHVESGNRLNGALLRAGLVDELLLYVAPQLLGDAARGMFDLGALTQLDQRVELRLQDVRRVGPDLRIVARVGPHGALSFSPSPLVGEGRGEG
jgi:diaminohydroxyphosphoribosylaminopyrimidine deaminase/5-amino-6-(5-phosphoribosylamino)uracil reductase